MTEHEQDIIRTAAIQADRFWHYLGDCDKATLYAILRAPNGYHKLYSLACSWADKTWRKMGDSDA